MAALVHCAHLHISVDIVLIKLLVFLYLWQIEGLERNKLSGTELLSRIQLLENRVDAATAVAGMEVPAGPPGSNDAGSAGSASSNDATSSSSVPARPCTAAAGGSIGSNGFSPFAQAKLVQQVAALEQQTKELQVSSAQMAFRTEQVRGWLAVQ